MRYFYGISDLQFPGSLSLKDKKPWKKEPLDSFQFHVHPTLQAVASYDKKDVSILFKATPDTLLQLAANVVDNLTLPHAFEWNNWQVCLYIRNIGYPQYQRAFRKNLIHGRSLILVDAAALIAMNITDWEHIKRITFFIRCLYHYEMTKFARSISLPYQYWNELYLVFRRRTGEYFEKIRRTDFYRMWGLLRSKPENLNHFEKLERWLALYKQPGYEERIAGAPLYGRVYKECIKYHKPALKDTGYNNQCSCDLCDCTWEAPNIPQLPWNLKIVKRPPKITVLDCPQCPIPPCTCQWKPKEYTPLAVHSILTCFLSNRYAKGRHLPTRATIQSRGDMKSMTFKLKNDVKKINA